MRRGIDVEALSINPYWYRAGRDVAAELIKVQNETLVEFCAANPDRFVGFATAALQHPELAAEQVEHAVKKLGFKGVGGRRQRRRRGATANPRFHPFWAKCETRRLVSCIRSGRASWSRAVGWGSGLLTNTIGNPLETTIALSHLIFEGTLDRFPGLKSAPRTAEVSLPSYANRSDAVCRTFPTGRGPLPKKKPTAYPGDGQPFLRHDRSRRKRCAT